MVVGVVACSATKAPRPCPAAELYRGALFRMAATYMQRHAEQWVILSAKYGVVLPTQVVAPYNQQLGACPVLYRRAWGRRVHSELLVRFPRASFLVVAGAEYLVAMAGLPFTRVVTGRLGEQLHQLKQLLAQEGK